MYHISSKQDFFRFVIFVFIWVESKIDTSPFDQNRHKTSGVVLALAQVDNLSFNTKYILLIIFAYSI